MSRPPCYAYPYAPDGSTLHQFRGSRNRRRFPDHNPTMRIATLLLALGLLPGPQDPPSFEAGFREVADVSAGGWHRRLGPDSSDRKKAPLLYQPPSKPCPYARNNGGMTYEIGGPPTKE